VLIGILVVVNIALILYLFLLSARIVLSWFSGTSMGRPWELLKRATDPYLGLFYRMRFLRRGPVDFTPVVAVLALVVVQKLVGEVIRSGRISVGIVASSVLLAAWSGASFLLLLFLVIGVLRAIPLVTRALPGATLWKTLDLLVQPLVAWVSRLFRLEGRANYAQRLLLTLGLLLVAWFLGRIAIKGLGWNEDGGLVGLLARLPF
jgi:YggT family protein